MVPLYCGTLRRPAFAHFGGCGFTSHKIGPGQHGWYRSEHLGNSSPSCGPVAGDQMALRLLPDDLLHRTHTQTDSKRSLALWTHLRGTVRRTLTYTSTHSLCTHARTRTKRAKQHYHMHTKWSTPLEFLFFPPFMQLPPCQSTMIKMIARNRSTGHALTASWVGPFISLVAITHPEPLKQLLKGTEGRRLLTIACGDCPCIVLLEAVRIQTSVAHHTQCVPRPHKNCTCT